MVPNENRTFIVIINCHCLFSFQLMLLAMAVYYYNECSISDLISNIKSFITKTEIGRLFLGEQLLKVRPKSKYFLIAYSITNYI